MAAEAELNFNFILPSYQLSTEIRGFGVALEQMSNFLITSKTPLDLLEERKQGQSLFINFKIESPIKGPVLLSMECEAVCDNSIDISSKLKRLALNEWQEMNLSLACFEKAGASLAKISAPFQISSSNDLTLSISEVSLKTTPNVDQCE